MGYQVPLPPELQRVEYVKLYFHLEMVTFYNLPKLALLQLRRELQQALKTFSTLDDGDFSGSIEKLLKPSRSNDPVVKRLVQMPAPAMIMSPSILRQEEFNSKQMIVLPVIFIGSGIEAISSFVDLLQHLGSRGIYHGCGQFQLSTIEAEDGSGWRSVLDFDGHSFEHLIPPVCNLIWWLERQEHLVGLIKFEIISPMRILKDGKPVFKADFADIFPFILRRVMALLTSHAGVELPLDMEHLIAIAGRIKASENRLKWQDWRTLKGNFEAQNLGGLMGHLCIDGDELPELIWLLQLGTMFNCGKGAAYGAGQFRLICS